MKNKHHRSKPTAKRAPRNPPFKPTAEDRKTVEFMAAAGIPEDRMVQLVVNPRTKYPIDAKTLRKHFRLELDGGHAKADTMVAQGLFKNATTPTDTYPGGIPLAQIFWLKTRARWKPPEDPDESLPSAQPAAPAPGSPGAEQEDLDMIRRLAFTLARGAAAEQERTTKPKKKVTEPA